MNQRIRVLHVTGSLDMGGQEKLLVEFAKHADRDRFELRCVSLTARGTLADELEALGCPVTAFDLAPGFHPSLMLRLASLCRRESIDVVHTHNERPLIYAAPAARLGGASCVIHTKHGRGTSNTRRQNWLSSIAARCADRFVCVSNDCSQLAAEQGIPAARIVTLRNGIDTRAFAHVGPDARGPAVIVARLCADKDHATLLHAVARIAVVAPDFRLRIAGDGECLADLRTLVQRLALEECVQFLGAVRDVPALLRGARFKVLSSVSEGVSLTLLEAMASGVPVVATNVGGTPEVVVDGVTGLLVPPRDPDALAAAMLRLHRDADLGQRLGEAARARVVAQFDVCQMVAGYERLYLESARTPKRRLASPSAIENVAAL